MACPLLGSPYHIHDGFALQSSEIDGAMTTGRSHGHRFQQTSLLQFYILLQLSVGTCTIVREKKKKNGVAAWWYSTEPKGPKFNLQNYQNIKHTDKIIH